MPEKIVDVEKAIADKDERLLRRLPGFVINYLKRILHEDEINDYLTRYGSLPSGDFCDQVMESFNLTINICHPEKVPLEGGAILAGNHPIGGLDALAVVSGLRPYRSDIKFIVNDLLLDINALNGIFIGVNKHGANSRASLRKVDDLFHSEQVIFVFPAGLVSRKQKGKIMDLTWKKTFITRAKKHHKPIVPVHIDGRLSDFFYGIANLRKFLGIKNNLEMLYLANEQFKQNNKVINITFGDLIRPEELDKTKSDEEWANHIKEIVYQLPDHKKNES